MGALDGISVLDLSDPKGHFAGKLLAGLGADVIKIEPPGGDVGRSYGPFLDDQPGLERSLYWWHYHTSKRSVVVDLDDEEGRDRFRALVATAQAQSPSASESSPQTFADTSRSSAPAARAVASALGKCRGRTMYRRVRPMVFMARATAPTLPG